MNWAKNEVEVDARLFEHQTKTSESGANDLHDTT